MNFRPASLPAVAPLPGQLICVKTEESIVIAESTQKAKVVLLKTHRDMIKGRWWVYSVDPRTGITPDMGFIVTEEMSEPTLIAFYDPTP